MSSPQPLTLDTTRTARVPFARLVGVELRKSADTRAGVWLLGAIVLITAGFMLIFFAVADPTERTFGAFSAFAATPQGFLLPVLGILLATTEWSQRTAMVTFTLEASRLRVIAAKTAAAVLLGFGAYVIAIAAALLFTAVGGAPEKFESVGVTIFALFLLLQLLTIVQGLAYGLLLLNTPAAIVVFFVVPIASSIVFSVVSGLQDIGPWIDLGSAQAPLFDDSSLREGLTEKQYAQLATTSLLWIGLPFALGVVRVMRAEVK